jgi:hypothetical protein
MSASRVLAPHVVSQTAPGPPSSQLGEIEENRKQTVPWTSLLDIPAHPSECRVETRWSPACRHWRPMNLAGSTPSAQSPDDRVETATPLFHELRRLPWLRPRHRLCLAMAITVYIRRRGHALGKTGSTKPQGQAEVEIWCGLLGVIALLLGRRGRCPTTPVLLRWSPCRLR